MIENTKPIHSELSFGQALRYAKEGRLIARTGWNGKGMFVFMMKETFINYGSLNHFGTLPVNAAYALQHSIELKMKELRPESLAAPNTNIKFTAHLCMKAADDSVVVGWLASQTDMLSEDWCVIL